MRVRSQSGTLAGLVVPRLGHVQQPLRGGGVERLDLLKVRRRQDAILWVGQPPPERELMHRDGADVEHGRVAPAT